MSKNEGSHGPQGPWAQNHKTIKIIKNYENHIFQHQNSAKGALNDSSRSLIWSFLEQIVFLEIGEQVSKVSKVVQFWAQVVCLTKILKHMSKMMIDHD